jgi:hypothetical protein
VNRDAVKTDETGLHAHDCECVRCATGYRPTELERMVARRALMQRVAAQAKESRAEIRARGHAALVAATEQKIGEMRAFTPPSPEERAAMRADLEAMKKGKSHG